MNITYIKKTDNQINNKTKNKILNLSIIESIK